MTEISARSILSSYDPVNDTQIDTFLLTYPRWIHAEFMTHRAFSRNAASSRAIPVRTQIEAVLENPAKPMWWLKEKKGMQGGEPLLLDDQLACERMWDDARLNAVRAATYLSSMGVHKSLANRLLEPYSHIRVLVTATEWDNFFELRDHPDAEPHFRALAIAIKEERAKVIPTSCSPGDWHLPFVGTVPKPTVDLFRRSVACCASTSYRTVEGDEMEDDRAIFICDKLKTNPLHASPFEHQGQLDVIYNGDFLRPVLHRNFRGWIQMRALIERGELFL